MATEYAVWPIKIKNEWSRLEMLNDDFYFCFFFTPVSINIKKI